MSKKQTVEAQEFHLDWLKWLFVLVILAVVAVANSIYSEQSLLYRVLGGLVLGGVAVAIVVQTKQGSEFWNLAKGSRAEVHRVVWPTKVERNRATMMVVLFVFFMSLVLWGLDALFGWLGSMLLG